jgi:hypothetical protein
MALSDKLKAISEKAAEQLDRVKQNPDALKKLERGVKTVPPTHAASATEASHDRMALPAGVVSSRLVAGTNADSSLASPVGTSTIEVLLGSTLPDWAGLLRRAGAAKERDNPIGLTSYAERDSLRSSRGLRKGDEHDLWTAEGGLVLYSHPGLLDRLLGWLFGILACVFAPILSLRQRVDTYLARLAARLGAIFAFISIPFAILGFILDAVALCAALLRALPALVFSPIRLIREILAIPFRLAMALASRLLRTALLAWLGRWLADARGIEELLRRHPSLRGVILGFLRSGRPAYPVLIPSATVSQVLHGKKLSLGGVRHYLIIVEGNPIVPGIGAWWRLKMKQLILPFYWERTIHMLHIIGRDAEQVETRIAKFLSKPVTMWS